eukprot:9060244-Prorocentrum_lima.AAC.1
MTDLYFSHSTWPPGYYLRERERGLRITRPADVDAAELVHDQPHLPGHGLIRPLHVKAPHAWPHQDGALTDLRWGSGGSCVVSG